MSIKLSLISDFKWKTTLFSKIRSGAAVLCLVTQLCLTLCDPMDCSPLGSSVLGILQARRLAWLPCPPPGDLPDPGIELGSLVSPALAGGLFTASASWEAPARVLQETNVGRSQRPGMRPQLPTFAQHFGVF